jgi:hypothetical protein
MSFFKKHLKGKKNEKALIVGLSIGALIGMWIVFFHSFTLPTMILLSMPVFVTLYVVLGNNREDKDENLKS